MVEKIVFENYADIYPYWIYQRVNLPIGSSGIFIQQVVNGYWYHLKRIHCKFSEIDAAGLVFNNALSIEIRGSSRHRSYQNAPIPINILTVDGSNPGVTVTAAGQMSATGPKNIKLIDEMLPQSDNIEIYISGQNTTPFPAFCDVLLIGHLIPDKSLIQFKGAKL